MNVRSRSLLPIRAQRVRASGALAVVVFLIVSLGAARAATVRGKVTDPLGGAVANATVDLCSQNGKAVESKTDSEGRYELAAGSPGRFHVRVAASGFAASESDWFY